MSKKHAYVTDVETIVLGDGSKTTRNRHVRVEFSSLFGGERSTDTVAISKTWYYFLALMVAVGFIDLVTRIANWAVKLS